MDPDGRPIYFYTLAILLVGTLLYVFSSFAEGAIGSLSRARIQRLAERDLAAARAIQDFAERPAFYVTATGIIRLASLLAIAITVTELLKDQALPVTSVVAWAALLFGALVLGWIVPRAGASVNPEGIALTIGRPLKVLSWIITPIVNLVALSTSELSKLFGGEESPEAQVVTTAELKVMVAASEEEGLIEQRERTMIDNILELEEVSVREIMVPRPDIAALDVTSTVREAVDVLVRERYSRYPVFRDSIDDIVGILYGKDLFQYVLDRRLDDRVGDLLRPAYFVPESKKCDDLLRELQQQRVHIAIVVDEYGGTSGLVTIEDLLEEIVGEIQDEFDVEEQKIVPEGDGNALVNGSASIDDVNDALSLDLTTEEVDTIGGLVYERLGRIPVVGDQVRVDGALLTVVGSHGRRVTRVRVRRIGPETTNGATTGTQVGEDEWRKEK